MTQNANDQMDQLTLAGVLARLADDSSLSAIRRRDLCSAIRRLCALIERDPHTVSANVADLKAAVSRVHPVQAGISVKTWQNIKANALAGLRHANAVSSFGPTGAKLSKRWQDFIHQLPEKRQKNGLSRFIRFCSAQQIVPEDVSDEVVDGFMKFVRVATFIEKPNDMHRRTTRLWNEAVTSMPNLPFKHVTVPDYRTPRRSIPLDQLPVSFQKDVEVHLAWMEDKDLLADHRARHACKPSTIRLRRNHIELAASAYIQRDHPAASLQSLASLVDVNAFTEVLRYYLEHNNRPTQFMRDLAKALILIAKDWVGVDQAQLDQLKALRRRLGPERSGLTEKNRAALRQLDDDRNKALLILLPQRLFEEVRRKDHGDVRAAVAFQVGLAIELLWMAPMRMGNLINLRLDRHVVRPGGKHGPVHLVVPGTETKNGEEIEYPLPTESRELLDEYLKKFHPTIAPAGSVWLFPSQGGQRKAQQTLSQQIVETVKERTGLRLTPHQFRHIAAKVLLDADPGNFEAARRLLGHRNMKTTTNFYTGLQTKRAAQHYDAILSQERERLSMHVLDNRKRHK